MEENGFLIIRYSSRYILGVLPSITYSILSLSTEKTTRPLNLTAFSNWDENQMDEIFQSLGKQ